MTKQEFITNLREKLMWLTSEELEKTVNFYSEMIDDRMEEGASEEEAVAALGSMDDITVKIAREVGKENEENTGIPAPKTVVVKNSSENTVLKILIVAVTFPIWFPIIATVLSVGFGLLAGLFGICVGFGGAVIGGLLSSIRFFVDGNAAQGAFMLGVFIFSIGVCIFIFFGFIAACKAAGRGIKKLFKWVKELFDSRKENSNESI